jgi:DNA-binding NtrC family response regulator
LAGILVVDDEPDITRKMKQFLEREGHEVVVANDGLEALAILNDVSVDVAFVDIVMPKVDGLTLMRQMLQDHPRVRVIVMSAFEDVIDLPEREFGLVRTLKKPFGLDEAKAALDLALGMKEKRVSS